MIATQRCRRMLAVALTLGVPLSVAAQTVYKCETAAGTVYSQRPCAPDAELKHGSTTAQGAWKAVPVGRDLERAVGLAAEAVDPRGRRLSIYRIDSGEVHLQFALGDNDAAVLDNETAPSIAIDDNPAFSLRQQAWRKAYYAQGEESWDVGPEVVTFQIGRGVALDQRNGVLKQLLDGQALEFRYRTQQGGQESLRLSLAGAREVLYRALELRDNGSDGLLERQRAFQQAVQEARQQCQEDTYSHDCYRQTSECSAEYAGDTEGFLACSLR